MKFFNKLKLIFFYFKYLHPIQIILFIFNHLFAHSQTVLDTAMYQQQFNISHLFAHI